jgi:hypothetical protein
MNREKLNESTLYFEPVYEDIAKQKKHVSSWPITGPCRTHRDF